MIERHYNPFRIGTALLAVGPKSQEDINFTNIDPERINAGTSSWIKTPYMHEYALAKAYFGLAARKGKFDKDYVKNLTTIFGWILELDRDKYKGEAKMIDRIAPLFFNDKEIMDIKRQYLRLQREDFFTNPELLVGMNIFLGACVMRMIDVGILRIDNSLPGNFVAA